MNKYQPMVGDMVAYTGSYLGKSYTITGKIVITRYCPPPHNVAITIDIKTREGVFPFSRVTLVNLKGVTKL